jgi:tetratricopeptide (TPR) repeat protein
VRGTSGTLATTAARTTAEVLKAFETVRWSRIATVIITATIATAFLGGVVVGPPELAVLRSWNPRAQLISHFWVGQKVVTKYPTPLTEDGRVIDEDAFRVYSVERIQGDRVRITTGRIAGWVQARELVPFDQAVTFYTSEIASDPYNTRAYHRRASVWGTMGEFDKAIADATEVIRLRPDDRAFYLRALLYGQSRRFDDAVADLTESIRLSPGDPSSYMLRAWVRFDTRAFDNAIADCGDAIRLEPRNATAYGLRGKCWLMKREYDLSLDDLNQATKLNPDDARAWANLGLVSVSKGNYDHAIFDCNDAIRRDPQDGYGYYVKGLAEALSHRVDDAIEDLDHSVRLQPRYGPAYMWRAWCRSGRSDYRNALADYDEAVRLDPTDTGAHGGRAWLLATCPDPRYRDGKKAVESATEACDLTRWRDADQLKALAAACAETGDFKAAVRWQTRVIDLRPGWEDKEPDQILLNLYRAKQPYHTQAHPVRSPST